MRRATLLPAVFLFAGATAALGACGGGGGGGGGGTGPPVPPPTSTPPATTAAVLFQLSLGSTITSSAVRRTHYVVSGATKSASVIVSANGVAASPVVVNCASGQCSQQLTVPVGNDTFTVTLYDNTNATGSALAAGITPFTVVASGTPQTIPLKLGAVVHSTSVLANKVSVTAGAPDTATLTLNAFDADNFQVQGTEPFVDAKGNPSPVPLAIANDAPGGATGAFTASAGGFPNQGASITVSYNGGALNAATFNAGTSSPKITVTPAIVADYAVPGAKSLGNYLVAGPDGNLWFPVDPGGIGKMSMSGVASVYPVGTSSASSSSTGLAVGPDGNLWMERDNTMLVVSTAGTLVAQYVIGARALPMNLTAAPDGALWFCDERTGTIDRMTTSGALTTYPFGQYTDDVKLGPDNNLWVSGPTLSSVSRIALNGAVTTFSGVATHGAPFNVTPGPDGNLWYFEANSQYQDWIGRITTSGRLIGESGGAFNHPGSPSANFGTNMVAGRDGNMWYTELGSGYIARVVLTGGIGEYALTPGPPLNAPAGITVGPDGNIWFAELDGKIGKLVW